MVNKKLIYSGGGGSTPKTAANNLFSSDKAEVLIGIGEGPIEGLENGEKSFFFDDTPLIASDDSHNFTDYELEIMKGDILEDETIKYRLGGSGLQTSVGIELKHDQPISRVTQSGNIDYIDIRMSVGQLYHQGSKGDVSNASVSFKIEYKRQDQTSWLIYTGAPVTISGKTTSTYAKDYRIPVNRSSDYCYEIRITKITEDSPTDGHGDYNTLHWVFFEEVVAGEGNYPNTALAHLVIKTTDQLTSIPKISGIYKLLKIKIPSNYNPSSRSYSGEWDGTFNVAWTDNPAWCLYDLIMNDRYGVNAYYPVTADKWDFYEAAKYCDELVPDGLGGTEPRYTLNLVIEDSQTGPDLINYIAGVFNATIYEDGSGVVRLSFQHDQQATHIFSTENVTPSGFVYNFSDPSTRYNDISVSFMNESRGWISDTRRVYDTENVSEWGRIVEEYTAVGCIKESEALRRARYRLISNLTETMSVTFTTCLAGCNINLFDTILIADKNMGYSISGRFKELDDDGMHATLRDSIFLEAGVDYTLNVQTIDGPTSVTLNIKEVGYVKDLYFTDPLIVSSIPDKTVFSLTSLSGKAGSPKPFRVTAISENQSEDGGITITATEINRNKQIEADNNIELSEPTYTELESYFVIPHVKNVTFTQKYVGEYKQIYTIISPELDYEAYPYYTGDIVVYSREQGTEAWTEREVKFGDTLIDHPSGTYEFKVLPKTTLGKIPNIDTAPIFTYDVVDITEPPGDVTGFTANPNVNNIVFTWDKVDDPDLIGYEIRKGSVWEEGEVIATYVVDNHYTYNGDIVENTTFMIKAIDVLNNYSRNYAFLTTKLSAPLGPTAFYVTPNLDNLRFDWDAPLQNNVEYEVRIGESWDSALKLFKTAGNNQTVLNPTYTDSGFLIRAVSKAGIYSNTYMYAESRIELQQNRNVILEIDNAEAGWPGATTNLEPTEFPEILAMKQGAFYAEHYFNVHLPSVTYARNWYETEGFKYGTRLTFEDLNYAWGSEEAAGQNWLNSTAIGSTLGNIRPVITYKFETPYTHDLGFRFNDDLNDVTGEVIPYDTLNVAFAAAKYGDGLIVHRQTKESYQDVLIGPQFSIKFRIKIDRTAGYKLPVFRLLDNNGNYIYCYIYMQNTIIIQRSDGVQLSKTYSFFSDTDFLYFMLTQDDTKLRLDYSVEYANISGSEEVECVPLATFTKLNFGGKS